MKVFLLLGTNLGDRGENLRQAIVGIGKSVGYVSSASSVYQTAAWGKTDQPDFYNQVVAVDTALTPEDVLKNILSIELQLGRQRIEKWGERVIDIDLLLYGNLILKTEQLTVPHPHMATRRFTLMPLAEIAGDTIHPVYQKKISTLLQECPDPLLVKLLAAG